MGWGGDRVPVAVAALAEGRRGQGLTDEKAGACGPRAADAVPRADRTVVKVLPGAAAGID
ncbi:MAG: hypothetical protein HY927_08705 [Elusimicrobia bacterium]|nr:hypothetical protein [Elusimicrobiota bacterium]